MKSLQNLTRASRQEKEPFIQEYTKELFTIALHKKEYESKITRYPAKFHKPKMQCMCVHVGVLVLKRESEREKERREKERERERARE